MNKKHEGDIMETRKRSIAKTITFRIFATITTMTLVLILTGDIKVAGIVGLWDTITKLALYYFHERAWLAVKWGRRINS